MQPTGRDALLSQSNLEPAVAAGALEQLLAEKQIVAIGRQLMTQDAWQGLLEQAIQIVGRYHRQAPLRAGMAREALRSHLKVSAALFTALLEELTGEGRLVETGTAVRLPSFSIQFDPQQKAAVGRLMDRFTTSGVNSPSVKESKAAVGDDIYSALLDLGMIHQLNEEVVYATAEYQRIIKGLRDYLQENRTIIAAQARDLLTTTRKYAIAFLEHLDELKITRRVGDGRELRV
jgi:selenocysteine-specific elongation factor